MSAKNQSLFQAHALLLPVVDLQKAGRVLTWRRFFEIKTEVG